MGPFDGYAPNADAMLRRRFARRGYRLDDVHTELDARAADAAHESDLRFGTGVSAGVTINLLTLLAIVLSVGLGVYLAVALLAPEKFS